MTNQDMPNLENRVQSPHYLRNARGNVITVGQQAEVGEREVWP